MTHERNQSYVTFSGFSSSPKKVTKRWDLFRGKLSVDIETQTSHETRDILVFHRDLFAKEKQILKAFYKYHQSVNGATNRFHIGD